MPIDPPAAPPEPRDRPQGQPTPATDTFAFDLHRLGVDDTFAPGATLHRRLPSTSPVTTGMPAMPFGTSGSDIWTQGEKLGEGGMGVVYAATDTVLVRTVAMKRARQEGGARAANALIAEARILATLDHPNIVPVHALGLDADGAPILVMKRVSGQRWSDLLRAGRQLDRDLRILLEVTDALRFAHARGLLHRDLKPDNVMVGEFGEVYLMDWGCACRIDEGATVEIVGTPACMAPEMLRLHAPIGPATDVFLLGGMLQEALTGRPRHRGNTVREVLENAAACRPHRWGPEVPAALADIVERACARAMDDRYPTVEAFAAAVRGFVAHHEAASVATRATAALARLEAAVATGDPRAELLFAECRFGFRGALDGWPDCAEAQEGLARAYEIYLPWKIRIGELDTAAALLPELDPEAGRRWAAELTHARRVQEVAAETLRSVDLMVASRERRNLVIGALLTGVVIILARDPTPPPSEVILPAHIWLACGPPVIVLAWTIPFRRRIFANRVSSSILMSTVLLLLAQVFHRLLAWWSHAPVDATLRGDCTLMGAGLCVLALSTHMAVVLAALPYFVGAAAMTVRPDEAVHIFPAAMFVSTAVVMVGFYLLDRQRPKAVGG